ncbi:MAG: type I methionyl aminopeptidase [Desulfobulbaceae bacterium S5133MH15]|nr:MAG: type I methionyl aminopeptidase [Desulfobulbaceae bacterium S5133MH15]OEU80779.1 MAG: type I methionyl aminopeptidase [Desulfobulbaceae bacterium C00003063]
MREANRIVSDTLTMLKELVEPGITTWELDKSAEELCIKRHGKPAFKGYRGFPGSLCVSVNEEVVHGIPSRKTKLKDGDIISIDFGVEFKGFFGDSAITVPVGKIDAEVAKLLKVTEESLAKGIEQVVAGNRVGDISRAIQNHVEGHGLSIVRQFVGHGIGSALHEPPEIPNFFQGERTPRLLPGMVLAIEPMVNMGSHKVKVLKDGWTVITSDKQPSAHFEHSVAVTENGPAILSRCES